MKKSKDNKPDPNGNLSRRKFLKGCGITVLATASYEIISVLGAKSSARADYCGEGCTDLCVTSCTSSTCVGDTIPDPPPPTCVQDFKGDDGDSTDS